MRGLALVDKPADGKSENGVIRPYKEDQLPNLPKAGPCLGFRVECLGFWV